MALNINQMITATKYYYVDFAIRNDLDDINPEEITGFVKDGKSTENWIFVQIDGSIKCAFDRYGMPDPKYVFVNRNWRQIGEMCLTIVRDNFKNEKEAMFWNVSKMYIQEELSHQAWVNSDVEEGIIYKFEII